MRFRERVQSDKGCGELETCKLVHGRRYGFIVELTFCVFSFQLLSYLHDVILKNERNGNSVDAKLRRISEDLHSSVVNHLQVCNELTLNSPNYFIPPRKRFGFLQTMMETIIKSAEEECPTVFENEKFQNEIRSKACRKNNFDPEFVDSCIVGQAGTQIMNKIKYVHRYKSIPRIFQNVIFNRASNFQRSEFGRRFLYFGQSH